MNIRPSARQLRLALILLACCACAVAITAVIGTAIYSNSKAATPYHALEAENGTIKSPAVISSDNDASQDTFVQFGSAAGDGTSFTPTGMRPLPDPLYGVTFDNANGIGTKALNEQITALNALPHKPITRIVFDEGTTPAGYTTAINTLQPNTYLMGELIDSYYMKTLSVQAYKNRVGQFLTAFGDKVDLWEIGNEVNGNWTGPYSDVAAKITGAYDIVKSAGKRTELTLWYAPNCGGPGELGPVEFSNTYLPETVRKGFDYVTISYYETGCNNYRPTAATLTTLFLQLHTLYPNARLGMGEVGLEDFVSSATLPKAQSIASYYYGLKINLPYYVGGYFWWCFAEDAIPASKPLWQTINDGMKKY